jgi:hypothetical protein
MFSSSGWIFVVLGIGTIQGFCASNQANSICAAVAFFARGGEPEGARLRVSPPPAPNRAAGGWPASLVQARYTAACKILADEPKISADLLAVTADHGMPPEPSSPDRRHLAPSIVDLLHEKFDPEAKQLITSFEPENGQIFVDEDRLSSLGLTLRDLAHFLESQPFLSAVFTNDDVRRAANAVKPTTPTRKVLEVK